MMVIIIFHLFANRQTLNAIVLTLKYFLLHEFIFSSAISSLLLLLFLLLFFSVQSICFSFTSILFFHVITVKMC